MKKSVFLTALFLGYTLSSLRAEIALQEGDCWSYDTRPEEEDSFIVIRKIETLPRLGEVVHISIFGLKLKSAFSPTGYTESIADLAYSGAPLRASLKARVTRTIPSVDWEIGYKLWRQAAEQHPLIPVQKPLKFHLAQEEADFSRTQPTTIDPTGKIGVSVRHVLLPPWQVRRIKFAGMMAAFQTGDPTARQQLDTILWEATSDPYSRTPLETLELLGFYYLPKDGIEKTLPRIVTAMTVGWYDALRYAAPAGQAELAESELFFRKAFLVASEPARQAALMFLADNPGRAKELIAQGFVVAERMRHDARYDHRWPSTFGPVQGAAAGTPELSRVHWADAWEEAKNAVSKALEEFARQVPAAPNS